MNKKFLYSVIIVLGVGAIAYMYNLTDSANQDENID